MPTCVRDDLTLHWAERGDPGGRPIVLLHGLLFSSRLFERVAPRLTGQRVLLLDLHGHGGSSKPTDPARYTWDELVADVTGLLDHLGLERATVGGLSLGANVTLAMAHRAPERLAALVLEAPVLHRGHRFGRPLFTAMASAYAGTRLVAGPVAKAVGRLPLPRRAHELAALRDMASQPPAVAAAVLRGLLADDAPAEDEASLALVTQPALVIGHRGDWLHALADARDLAGRLPNARLAEVSSLAEHRLRPQALADLLLGFLSEVP